MRPTRRRISSLAITLVLSLVALFGVSALVYGYLYRAQIQVTENGTSDWDMVACNITVNNQWLADNGFMQSDAMDTRVATLSGTTRSWMVVDDRLFFATPLEQSGIANLYYTTGETAASAMDIIAGHGGYVTLTDNATAEPSGNFTIAWSGYFLADTAGYEINKDIGVAAERDGSGGLAAYLCEYYDPFSADHFTDVGTKIVVNTGTTHLEYEAERSADDERTYQDFTDIDDGGWRLRFLWHPTSTAGTNPAFWFGLTDTLENTRGATGDAVYFREVGNTARITAYDGGAATSSDTIAIVQGSTYYVSLERTSTTSVTLHVYSDSDYTTDIAGSPVTVAIPATITGTRYLQGSNYNDGSGAANEVIGYLDSLAFYQRLGATGITTGDHEYEISADDTDATLTIDGSDEDTYAMVDDVYDSSHDWLLYPDPYWEYWKLTIGGVPTIWYQPVSMIVGTTLPDRQGANEAGVFTFGSNPTGVTVTLGSMTSSGQPTVGTSTTTATSDLLPNTGDTDWDTDPAVAGALLTNPMRPVIVAISDNTELSERQVWVFYGVFITLILFAIGARTKHWAICGVATGIGIVFCVIQTIFPLMTVVLAALSIIGGLMAERSPTI